LEGEVKKSEACEGLRASLTLLQEEHQNAISELRDIYHFNPIELTGDIKEAEMRLDEISEQIESTPMLEGLKPIIDKIKPGLESLRIVAKDFNDIYKVFVLPVQKEGERGIKETARWAVLGIFVSVILSLFASKSSSVKNPWPLFIIFALVILAIVVISLILSRRDKLEWRHAKSDHVKAPNVEKL
jgi:hypothetical protein